MKRLRAIIVAFVPFLAGGLPVLGASSMAQRSAEAMNDLTLIERRAEIRLPSDAKLVYFSHETAGEEAIRAKILLPSGGLERFLSENSLAAHQFSVIDHGLLGSDEGEWDPAGQTAFPVFSRQMRDGAYLYLGYLPQDAGVLVYLHWFRT